MRISDWSSDVCSSDLPGFLFAPDNLQEASELMALVIERSWTARFYLATGVTVLQLCEGYRVDVYTRDPGVEQLVRYRLITPGARFSQPLGRRSCESDPTPSVDNGKCLDGRLACRPSPILPNCDMLQPTPCALLPRPFQIGR